MPVKTKKKISKKTRFNHFQVVLNSSNFKNKNTERDISVFSNPEFVSYLSKLKFVDQQSLESLLSEAKVKSKNDFTFFMDYYGHLERGIKNGGPYWKLFIETSKQTVAKELVNYFSRELYSIEKSKFVNAIGLKDVAASMDYPLKSEAMLTLPNSVWFPGIITKQQVDFKKLLTRDRPTRSIFTETNSLYKKYLLDK